jgi:hypothetical protein
MMARACCLLLLCAAPRGGHPAAEGSSSFGQNSVMDPRLRAKQFGAFGANIRTV